VSLPSLPAVDTLPGDALGAGPDEGVAAGAVVLRLGASRYAVDMADVAEVAQLPRVTRVPRSAAWLLGVANWRGRVLPVLDLRPLLATDPTPLPAPPTVTGEAAALVTGQVSDRTGPLAVLDAAAVLALRDRVDRRRGGTGPA
jgi:chemotaxis signal transduction protein